MAKGEDTSKHPGRIVDLNEYRRQRTERSRMAHPSSGAFPITDLDALSAEAERQKAHYGFDPSKMADIAESVSEQDEVKAMARPKLNTCTSCGEKTPNSGACLDCQQEGK